MGVGGGRWPRRLARAAAIVCGEDDGDRVGEGDDEAEEDGEREEGFTPEEQQGPAPAEVDDLQEEDEIVHASLCARAE